jgi:LAO/AO transport system kinase
VYIRSTATRGALGGVSVKTLEMIDVLRAANFDLIIVETVGVGQSEVEIAGLADKTLVVLVPESGDEIQNIKSGLMEIAQAFVVNKADREGADTFANNLKKMIHQQVEDIPVFKTIADKNEGLMQLCKWIMQPFPKVNAQRGFLLAEKALRIIQDYKMRSVNKNQLRQDIEKAASQANFNIYSFTEEWVKTL